MSAIKTAICMLLALILTGCGQVVSERLTTPTTADASSCVTKKTAVVLPLVDYSSSDVDEAAFTRSVAVMEALTDQLSGKGFSIPPYEDTISYLVENNILSIVSFGNQNVGGSYGSSIQNELNTGEWSDVMKNELKKQLQIQQKKAKPLQGLDKVNIAKIGRDFKANYIVRGRILKYDFREDENSWNPLRRGLIPIIFPDSTNRFLFGIANPEFYDALDGFATRAIVGNAVVHIRVWVQESSTGKVLWTNKAEVKVSPQTSFAGRNVDDLFHTAVDQAVYSLIEDFWMKTEAYL